MWGSQGWNQWALQPAMFNDVPHEQIDWAELAKQWIQMQQTQPTDGIPPAPPPPPLQAAPPPVSAPPPPPPGHGPLIPDENVAPALLKPPMPPASIPEPYHANRHFENESSSYLPKSDNSFWNKTDWEASAVNDVDERLWSTPPIEPAPTLIGGKETFDYGHMHDNPPLAMQSIDYNHMSDFSYNQIYPTPAPAPETHYDQYWSQVNAAPSISPMFLKKERVTASLPVEEESTQIGELSMQIDAAKRKQLPAWIRDGLEKMEQERLKRLEKEKAAKENAEKIAKSTLKKKDSEISDDPSAIALPVKSKFESDSEGEEETRSEVIVKTSSPVRKQPPSPVEDLRTEEEKKQDLMLRVRRMLTEVLLSVTNSEMVAIAQEMYRKAALKAPARQLASTTSLTSVATGLRGLASYGTESEASEAEEEEDKSDSDEELYRKIKEKKKLFAVKERKIIADIERRELEEKMEAERLQNEKNEKFNMEMANAEKLVEAINNSNNVGPTSLTPPLNQISDDSPSKVAMDTESMNDGPTEETEISNPDKILNPDNKGEFDSSDSSSNSSNHSSVEKNRKHHHKENKKSKVDEKKAGKRDKSSSKHSSRRKRSRSRDSSSSGKHKRGRSRDKKNSYKKKKKYKRSESSSSSGSSSTRKRHSSKHGSSHNHRDHRSHSYEGKERKNRRSTSPSKGHRRRSDGHSSRSHRYEEEKHSGRHKSDKRYRHSPSPGHSSKLPRKYRSSRSISSESESSGKKSKKSRNR